MEETVGTKELKELLSFIVRLVFTGKDAMADGKINLWDASKFFTAFTAAIPAINGLDQVYKELKDLEEWEVEDLKEYIIQEFELEDGKASAVIENCLEAALSIGKIGAQLF